MHKTSIRRRGATPLALCAAAVTALAAGACSDPFAPQAVFSVTTDSVALYAMTGTPPVYPSALDIYFHGARRIDPAYSFDIAFDLDENGNVIMIPVQLLGGAVTVLRNVGLQRITGSFDGVTSAPGSGYEYDSAFVVAPGQGVLVQTVSDVCTSTLSQFIYSKIKVIATNVTTRALSIEQVLDPNCGFRSFLEGIPKN